MYYDPNNYITAVIAACVVAGMTPDAAARLVARYVLVCIDRYQMDETPTVTAARIMQRDATTVR